MEWGVPNGIGGIGEQDWGLSRAGGFGVRGGSSELGQRVWGTGGVSQTELEEWRNRMGVLNGATEIGVQDWGPSQAGRVGVPNGVSRMSGGF